MPIQTGAQRKAYVEYFLTFDWGEAWAFTPEIRPDRDMTGKSLQLWKLLVMERVRDGMEYMLLTQVKKLNEEDTAPVDDSKWWSRCKRLLKKN